MKTRSVNPTLGRQAALGPVLAFPTLDLGARWPDQAVQRCAHTGTMEVEWWCSEVLLRRHLLGRVAPDLLGALPPRARGRFGLKILGFRCLVHAGGVHGVHRDRQVVDVVLLQVVG